MAPARAPATLSAVHRSCAVRLVAMLLAILASLTPPGAALAHGYAHHREYHGEHHGKHRDGADHPEHELRDDGSTRADTHDDRGAETPVAVAATPVASLRASPVLVDRHAAPRATDTHGHPTLDLPLRPRVDVVPAAVVTAPTAEVSAPEVRVPAAMPVPHAALPRADPDATPHPRLRAPPVR